MSDHPIDEPKLVQLKKRRNCGPCTACCTVMEVGEIDKAAHERCEHQRPGTLGGCKIYKERPESCRTYSCGWLLGYGESHERPDKLGVVLNLTGEGPLGRAVQLHEVRPGAVNSRQVRALIERFIDRLPVIVISKDGKRRMFAKPEDAARIVEHMEREHLK